MNLVIDILRIILNVAWWIILIQAILSWLIAFNVINTWNETVRTIWEGLGKLTEPLYRPIRRYMPDTGGLDLSPLVVLVLILISYEVLDAIQKNLLYG
jgi:YggT family protein